MPSDLERQFEDAKRLLEQPGARVHFMGAGGVGMAGLAVLLHEAAFVVEGCDVRETDRTARLRALGLSVRVGHSPDHIHPDLACLVRTPATDATHPEARAAIERGVPVVSRGVLLAAHVRRNSTLAVAGTHGKTTTSAMLAHLLERLGRRPGYCIGGDAPTLPGLARSAPPEASLVVEADESDGSLRLYEARIAVVTNIDFDHMEHFRNESEFHAVFERFARQAGTLILGHDDPGARRLNAVRPDAVRFGFGPDCAVQAESVERLTRGSAFDLVVDGVRVGRVRLPVEGPFNIQNALGAFAAAWRIGCAPDALPDALSDFKPVLRRQQRLGGGGGVEVVSDYAHHPTEIRALIHALRPGTLGRLIVVFQPHRYTRTRALGPDFPAAFDGADEVVLLPVYAASEAPVPGGTSEDLLRHMRNRSGLDVRLEPDFQAARDSLMKRTAPGDLLLIVGAGDVEELGVRIAGELSDRPTSERNSGDVRAVVPVDP